MSRCLESYRTSQMDSSGLRGRAYRQKKKSFKNKAGVFFEVLRVIEINVKDDFSLKNEVFLSKNVIFVYKGNYLKIHRKFSKNIETRFSNYTCIFIESVT